MIILRWWSCVGDGMERLYNGNFKIIREHDVVNNKKARFIARG